MSEIDWSSLSFGYMKTDYNVRCYYRNGAWGEIETCSEETIPLHMAATCLHYGQEAFEGLKAYRCPDGKVRVFRMDENGNAQSSPADVRQALASLVDFYDKHGQGYPLCIPLVGTGLSRARMSVKESFETIRDVFTANRERVHGCVSIVVLPGTWDELGLDDDGKGSGFR